MPVLLNFGVTSVGVVLMDGADLMAVLEERIDFVTLLLRKKRHAAQTGNIFLRVHEMQS